MSQKLDTLSTQAAQPLVGTLQAVINGLAKPSSFYTLVATHVSDTQGVSTTWSHELNGETVSTMDLYASHCKIIFKPHPRSFKERVLRVPYDAIEGIYRNMRGSARLYCAERFKGAWFERTLSRRFGLFPA